MSTLRQRAPFKREESPEGPIEVLDSQEQAELVKGIVGEAESAAWLWCVAASALQVILGLLILLTAPNLPNLPRTFALFLAIPSLLASAALSLDPSQVQTPLPKLLLALPPTILAIAALVSPLRMEERAVWIAPLVVMSLARYLEKAAGDMVAEAGGLQGLVYSSPSA